jgi:large subunit ribosomal protein L21
MYAIVDIAGQQFRVEKDKVIKVPYLNKEVGEKVEFDKVLLVASDKSITIGQPVVEKSKISAKVLAHGRDDKVIVWKKKKRKGYQLKKGHRQNFTKIQIEKIA